MTIPMIPPWLVPNQSRKNGASARGGIARNISINGLNISLKLLYLAIRNRQMNAIAVPDSVPIRYLPSVADTWGRNPLLPAPWNRISGLCQTVSPNLLTIFHGDGTLVSPSAELAQIHIRNNKTRPAEARAKFCFFVIFLSISVTYFISFKACSEKFFASR